VVSKLTSVVSERHDEGGVKIVVRGPRLAERKAEEREDILSFELLITHLRIRSAPEEGERRKRKRREERRKERKEGII
jgi:hypothetical protein